MVQRARGGSAGENEHERDRVAIASGASGRRPGLAWAASGFATLIESARLDAELRLSSARVDLSLNLEADRRSCWCDLPRTGADQRRAPRRDRLPSRKREFYGLVFSEPRF